MVKIVTYRGYKTYVQYDDETSYGTGASAPSTAIKGKISTVTINRVNNLIRTVGLGEGRNETFVGFGNFDVTWSMEYELASFEFLKYLIGAIGGTGTTVAPYYLQESDFMGYTSTSMRTFGLSVASDDVSGTDDKEMLNGCVINTGGLTLNVGETLKCSLEGFAQNCISTTSADAFTPDTTKPWIFSQGAFKWNDTAVARVTSATININNNFDPEVGRQLGSRFIQALEMGLRKYDFVLTVKMTDTIATTLRDHFYGGSGQAATGVADAEPTFYAVIFNLSEGSAAADRNGQILLSDASINDISKPINIGDNIVELTINGTAKSGTTDTVKKPFKWWSVS